MRYDSGPTRRVEPPRAAAPKSAEPKAAAPKTVTPKSRTGVSPGGTRSGVSPSGSSSKGGVRGAPSTDPAKPRTGTVTNWRDVRRTDPKVSGDISVATRLAGRGHTIATAAAAGVIGGVYPGSYRGGSGSGSGWYCDPWGWRGPGWGWSWSWSCGVSASWWWWSYPCYWAWYYPSWWWYSRPYYYYDYLYYPATTVVYAEPQVVYIEREIAPSEPVGEAVVEQRPAVAAPTAAQQESPLSIAAQRYLDLGDRAFREGRYTDAVQFYAKAVEFAPDQGALYLVLADALFAAGDYHYGAYAVRRALELDPALVESQVDKHTFYPEPALFDQQIATLERYLDQNPTDRDACLVLALNYLFGGRPADAARVLDANAMTMSRDTAAQLVLSQARASSGR